MTLTNFAPVAEYSSANSLDMGLSVGRILTSTNN